MKRKKKKKDKKISYETNCTKRAVPFFFLAETERPI